jgi:hypothetical protein
MADLIPSIAAHACGGVLLACGIWGVGLGALPRVNARTAPHAYAVGLPIVSFAATLVLLSWWLAAIVLPLLLVPLVRLVRASRPPFAFDRLLYALPGALGLGFVLGYAFHAPTERLDSSAFGDYIFYAVRLLSAAKSIAPIHDYAVEGMQSTYLESAQALIGAALSPLPGFDAFLFGSATLPACLVASLALGFGVVLRRGDVHWPLALLAVSCIAYPGWITESAPVALAVPLTFSIYALWRDGATRTHWLVLLPLLAFDFVLTKAVGLILLAVVAPFALVRQYGFDVRRALPYAVAAAAVAAVAIGVFAATSGWFVHILTLKFLPADAVRGLHSELDVRSAENLTPALRVVGEALLLAALIRARATALAAGCAASIGSTWFVGGHGFDVTIGAAVLLAVLFFADDIEAYERARPLVLSAAAVLFVSAWFRDVAGVRTAAVLVALFGLALFAALNRSRAAAVGAAALVLVSPLLIRQPPTTLVPADHDIWQHVADVVPKDGLVFTSLTGPQKTSDEGYNYYPAVARRQLYVAGWANSRLLVDRGARLRRLAANDSVLAGTRAPDRLPLSTRYTSFFAVTRRDDPVPPSFRKSYANDRYVLYRIES